MANHPSALKRARQSEARRLRNRAYKTRLKNAVREVRETAGAASKDKIDDVFKSAVSILQKSARRGVIHKKRAARKTSRLARLVNRARSS